MILRTSETSSSSVSLHPALHRHAELLVLCLSGLCPSTWYLFPCGNPYSTGETDGIIRTFDLFTAYAPGYFVVEVLARDLAEHSDVALVGIYILRDDQRVKIVINEIPERVRLFQEEFVNLLANITGAIVNTDDLQVRACVIRDLLPSGEHDTPSPLLY